MLPVSRRDIAPLKTETQRWTLRRRLTILVKIGIDRRCYLVTRRAIRRVRARQEAHLRLHTVSAPYGGNAAMALAACRATQAVSMRAGPRSRSVVMAGPRSDEHPLGAPAIEIADRVNSVLWNLPRLTTTCQMNSLGHAHRLRAVQGAAFS